MLKITTHVFIPIEEVELTPIRSQGAGGQHVNKNSTAIHLRFDINKSTLPEEYKSRLMLLNDYRITAEGLIIIKAQRYKSQEQNKSDALQRLIGIIKKASYVPNKRRKTKPSKSSITKRLDSKTLRGTIKKLRQPPL
ncbi:alternative ribosome rescue aminoacyl-tRNA hydrolase ArfB [Legionella quateirensis]|uniref:Peptidyl-tRNA hydrolase ArfB n=1 Tax=Legionella quateirensis TaxID=45072 RepID=A0A378KVQ7_9GAMM|nr:alternative ribosome rescue aminoacyl-tRNA hydrolase ArfB [Legionella quateirensis]KTD51169.1 Peptidyl-tRNA hydrolase ArfB [Legionella quateirensis]STY17587.1 Peptidyl-tRNA hydrolase YaeJ [Legionella quateirensis]